MSIRNVVFDIGNVFVRWAPEEIMRLAFGVHVDCNKASYEVFKSPIWVQLNKGLLTEYEARLEYQKLFGWNEIDCDRFFYYVKATQIQIYGTAELAAQFKTAGYNIYALTDNVNEVVRFLKQAYDFWPMFSGAIVSAEVGVLKPQPEIYRLLLSEFGLSPAETVFIDDMNYNIAGAEAVGIKGIQFENSVQCKLQLNAMGVVL